MSSDTGVTQNLATPTKYQIVFDRLPGVVFHAHQCTIPATTMGVATMPTPFKNIPFAGDKLEHEPFQMTFLLDEDHANYGEILHWIEGAAFPEDFEQYKDLAESEDGVYSDFTVNVFSNAGNLKVSYVFKSGFPISLGGIDYDSQNDSDGPMPISAAFDYMIFKQVPVAS